MFHDKVSGRLNIFIASLKDFFVVCFEIFNIDKKSNLFFGVLIMTGFFPGKLQLKFNGGYIQLN